ncbi:cytochrome C oxidase subunit I [Methylophilales bacterium MBRSG12]|uniref:Cytochrome C oxidase subunit I n=1 Tax=Methylophilales bacterium MBRS-H7 TaxID=1623450 RepID=A0A0H4IYF9_9PROT|nr:cytochrome C oxidase subunit I [Methylophilales bacterium MBRSF5]AKO65544.1 cytochrome C oxidase subunit I [Methylophilales bacterium MBRS-H7]AKO66864.1 cytochrome C oxidase subunit I [Methylophilales bacterium MBRSG12]
MNFYKRLTFFATVLALIVVSFGAYTRLTDSGLGCPDWPGCYGTLSVPESIDQIEKAQAVYPDSPVEVEKAWIEMIHRYIAGILGVMILVIAFMSIKLRDQINYSLKWPFFLLGLVIFQAALGMWTVTLLLKPAVVSSHLLGGMTVLGILTFLMHRNYGTHRENFVSNPFERKIIRFSLVLLFIQIALGGWTSTNYAALACTDYPTCHGSLIPEMDFSNAFTIFRELGVTSLGEPLSLEALHAIQWVHRVGAIVLLIYLLFVAYILKVNQGFNMWRNALILVITLQFIIGIANLLLHLPIVLATLHNLGAALLVVILVGINSRITKSWQN